MSALEMSKASVFLSSGFTEEIDGVRTRLPIRQRIIESHSDLPVDLELEVFAAAILQKPVLVLHQHGRQPEPPLRDMVSLFHRTFAASSYVVADESDLYHRFRAECDRVAANRQAQPESVLASLPDWMSRLRSHRSFGRELAQPSLRFLDGVLRSSRAVPDPAKARLLLEEVAAGIRGDAATQEAMPHGAALLRLWAAMRELLDESSSILADPTLAALWDRALGLWGRHASWFGLHGHLWMGPLASVQSQIELRRTFAAEPVFGAATDVREPLGARASALYSVAHRMHSRLQKLRHYRLAGALATQTINSGLDSRQGARLIRGHASLRMARLGHLWKLRDAVKDFRQALQLRERAGASAASVGEAKVAFAESLILTARVREGLALLQEGVEDMRTQDSATGRAFLARGLRSLERGARLARRRDLAEAARQERLSLAASVEAMDQTRTP